MKYSHSRPNDVLLRLLLLASIFLHQIPIVHAHSPWLQEHFPNPQQNPATCRAGDSHRICDPDGVLSASGMRKVEAYLETRRHVEVTKDCLTGATSENEADGEAKSEVLELQIGVALAKKMDLTPFGEDREDQAAETFARYVHDRWGVGVETESCGGAGVLLFLSIGDRTVYVSRGAALENSLTDRRLDQMIENMKDLLRSGEYDNAILQALHDMQNYIENPPTKWENFMHLCLNLLFPLGWILTVVGTLARKFFVNSRIQRDYARARSQLNEIDRARAEALQGRYRCSSCPICLEDFEEPPTEDGLVTKGSDGQPIKLLRCGHCMDETCWAEWITSGRGTITKCPICMQDVGDAPEDANNTQQREQAAPARRRAANDDNINNNIVNNNDFNNNEDRIMRQYRRERNFRLARLGMRYPQIVRPDQINRWTQPGYDGALVRDPSFVQSNPSVARPMPRSGGSRMGGGFGGSSSAGGRGGKW